MTMTKVNPIPEGMHTITAHLCCADAQKAMDFYKAAFGAQELARIVGPGGGLMHGMMKIGDSNIMLHDEIPQWDALGPLKRGGTSVTLHLAVADVDAWTERAVKAGASVKMPVADMFWGDRYGEVVDPFGHVWAIASRIKDMTPQEMAQAGEAAFANMGQECGPQS
jgi:uncharacterized glyoxalase superfamily protein PhnB